LDEIADYLGSRSPSAAVRVLEALLDRFELLASHPLMGEIRNDLPGRPRCFSSGNYLIVYQPSADGIEVARVVHGSRDVKSLLEPNE